MEFLGIVPVIPSQNIKRDIDWYGRKVGFEAAHHNELYAVLRRDRLRIHLQWHADTNADPLLGGSGVKVFVDDIQPIFEELEKMGTVSMEAIQCQTRWNTMNLGFSILIRMASFLCRAFDWKDPGGLVVRGKIPKSRARCTWCGIATCF